jgi:hypothetical protein
MYSRRRRSRHVRRKTAKTKSPQNRTKKRVSRSHCFRRRYRGGTPTPGVSTSPGTGPLDYGPTPAVQMEIPTISAGAEASMQYMSGQGDLLAKGDYYTNMFDYFK